MAKFARDSREFAMMGEYYVLMQAFWESNESDEFWESFVMRSEEFCKRYDNCLFARALVLALSDELERKIKTTVAGGRI